ncbi:uncharacterized protein EI90DRAFT_3284500 [Cantharellus anzutake]|uniref:uncharacterized protein n=1 Tax=Cantharellus anzutake TaxID=1750568 RepID=UPI001908AF82|nr:uncharacterized protein EI90DRAFT_3284500 [Cantharellus anzutake]KAF8343981.1 hypothetical protein EI90DRAFT_3284500 [Cantharellus anzutake]
MRSIQPRDRLLNRLMKVLNHVKQILSAQLEIVLGRNGLALDFLLRLVWSKRSRCHIEYDPNPTLDTRKLELAEEIVVLGGCALTWINTLEWLSESTETISNRFIGTIEERHQEGLRGIARKDNCLDGSTTSDGLVRVDRLGGLFIEEVRDEFVDARDTGGATGQDDLMDLGLVSFGITKNLLDEFEGATLMARLEA